MHPGLEATSRGAAETRFEGAWIWKTGKSQLNENLGGGLNYRTVVITTVSLPGSDHASCVYKNAVIFCLDFDTCLVLVLHGLKLVIHFAGFQVVEDWGAIWLMIKSFPI